MQIDLLHKFKNHSLTEEWIINEIITNLGGGLYAYKMFLASQERDEEQSLIDTLRDRIFKLRDTLVDSVKIASELKQVYDLLNAQLTVVKTIDDRFWEIEIFKSYQNDLLGAGHYFKDASKQ